MKDDGAARKAAAIAIGVAAVAASVYGTMAGAGGAVAFGWGLCAVVALHEAGHYVAARRAGMAVTEVGIGFGPVVGAWRWRRMRFSVRAVPAGAFVRIAGMSSKEKVAGIPEERTYRAAPWWRQVGVVAAGPAVNVVLAAVALSVGAAGTGAAAPWLEVVSVTGPAQAAGLAPGARVLSVNGRHHHSGAGLLAGIRSAEAGGAAVTLGVDQGGRTGAMRIAPVREAAGWRIGIAGRDGTRPVGAIGAMRLGAERTWAVAGGVWTGTARIFSPRTVSSALATLGSTTVAPPLSRRYVSIVGIVRIGVAAGRAGWTSLVNFLALVSMALGALNLLPISPLDGGHIVASVGRRALAGHRRLGGIARVSWQVGTAVGLAVIALVAADALWLDLVRPIPYSHIG